MSEAIDFWQLLGGLGLFLFGMAQLERALRTLGGRTFKRFLVQQTENPVRSATIGIVATALLQSSSFVGLTVLAFVGAGIIGVTSALGIIFGSNLGTTFTGWLVTLAGFKLQLAKVALPAVAVGCLGFALISEKKRLHSTATLVMGFGFLLLGLDFMKSGAADVAGLVDFSNFDGVPLILFMLLGVVLTAIIQSSSATMLLTLTALHAGAIDLSAAAAVVVGADLGTTGTVLLGAIAGEGEKKQVALGHFLFNLSVDVVAFVCLPWLLDFIHWAGISDPLFALVSFHSLFNLLGICVFLPLLKPFSKFLARRFPESHRSNIRYLTKADEKVVDASLGSLKAETRRLLDQAAALNVLAFDLQSRYSFYDSEEDRQSTAVFDRNADYEEAYQLVKQLEGAILSFALKLQEQSLEPDEADEIRQVTIAIRGAVHSAKCIKDIRQNIRGTKESPNDIYNAYYGKFRGMMDAFYKELNTMRKTLLESSRFEILASLLQRNEQMHKEMHKDIYREAALKELDEIEISTLLNVNREVFTSNKAMLFAIADAVLNPAQVEDLVAL